MFSKILQISQQHASRQHLLQRQVGESLRDGIFRRERSQEKQIGPALKVCQLFFRRLEDVAQPDHLCRISRHRVGPHQRLHAARRRPRGQAQARLRRLRVSQGPNEGEPYVTRT